MAHSLENMVVSSMIQDHGLSVSKYLMCNSAVPAEAYGAEAGITPEALKTEPLFRDFTQSEIYGENGSAYLFANNVFRWRVLSHGIPAESFATGARISCQQLLDEDEYMVIRTRMSLSQGGSTNGWHYAKLQGVINIGDILSFTQSVFNPRLNDTNLEFDVKENLAGTRGQSRWP